MVSLFFFLLSLNYEPRYWLSYPSMNDVSSITASRRSIYIAVPNGIYIFDRDRFRHQRTLTSADGISERIKLCAFNPAHNELLIATDSTLYHYLPTTGKVYRLTPPFKLVHSIGITPIGAFFDTETGLFYKNGPGNQYQQVNSAPEPVTWYGDRDTTSPHDFPFLTPYSIIDEQLSPHRLAKVWLEPTGHRLFVFAEGYGVLIYNSLLGLKECEIRLGPPTEEDFSLLRSDEGMWFFTLERSVLFDSTGRWHYFATRPEGLLPKRHWLLLNDVIELNRREGLTAISLLNGKEVLLGTNVGLYSLTPEGKLSLLYQFNRPVNAIASVHDSTLVATDDGLFILFHDTLVRITDPFARSDWGVFNIIQSGGNTFLGTLGGVLQLDSNNTWTHIIPPGFDLSQKVRAMAVGGNFLFIGTKNGIIAHNLKNKTWTTIDRTNGLPSEDIIALYADNRYLWIVSPGILSRYEYHAQLW